MNFCEKSKPPLFMDKLLKNKVKQGYLPASSVELLLDAVEQQPKMLVEETTINLLLDTEEMGKEWAISECTER